jgi:hypothetical protein
LLIGFIEILAVGHTAPSMKFGAGWEAA